MSTQTIGEFQRRLDELGSGGLGRAMRRTLIRTALYAEKQSKLYTSNRRLKVRTGRLRASIAGSASVRGKEWEVVNQAGGGRGAPVKYARLQELGGTVRPVRAKMLRIPLGPALTGAGVDRFPTPLRVSGRGQFFRKGSALFHVDDPMGPPWYALVKSVKIKPKHYLRDGLRDAAKKLPPEIRSVVRTQVLS